MYSSFRFVTITQCNTNTKENVHITTDFFQSDFVIKVFGDKSMATYKEDIEEIDFGTSKCCGGKQDGQ